MFWLVESKVQFEQFSNANWKKVFIELIPNSYLIHPSQNSICAVYIRPLDQLKDLLCHSTIVKL